VFRGQGGRRDARFVSQNAEKQSALDRNSIKYKMRMKTLVDAQSHWRRERCQNGVSVVLLREGIFEMALQIP